MSSNFDFRPPAARRWQAAGREQARNKNPRALRADGCIVSVAVLIAGILHVRQSGAITKSSCSIYSAG